MVKPFLLCLLSRGFKPDRITISTSLLWLGGYVFQEFLKEIFIPVDHHQPDFLGVLSQRVKPFLVFLIRMNVGIEKISDNFLPFFFESFKGIDCTVGTTDVKEGFHWLETVSSNAKNQSSKECQKGKLRSLTFRPWI